MPNVTTNVRTNVQDIDALLMTNKWAVTALSYSFPTESSQYEAVYNGTDPSEPDNGFAAFNAAQQADVLAVYAMYASVANLSFTAAAGDAAGSADLRFGITSGIEAPAHAYGPSLSAVAGDSWYKPATLGADPVVGTYAFHTLIHEIGHTVGLKHSHETTGFGAMSAAHDTMEYTIMSYRSYEGAGTKYTNEVYGFAQSLMMYDIAALQHMYGANYGTHSGDTVYSWDPKTGRMSIDGAAQALPGANRIFLTIWDGNGKDTYDLSNYTTAVTVDLRPGEWSTTAKGQLADLGLMHMARGNIANALLYQDDKRSLIENAIGGKAEDKLTGNQIENKLEGGAGADTLDGREGDDRLKGGEGNDSIEGGEGTQDLAIFSGPCVDYEISFNEATASWTIVHARGAAVDGTDILHGVEFVQFGDRVVRLEVGRSICASGGQDLVFVIDTTGSMWDDIDAVKAAATTLVGQVFADPAGATNSRIGVVGYKDPGETEAILAFTNDRDAAIAAINGISVDGGGDIPEGVYSGLLAALSGAVGAWREDTNIRRIILFGDAPPKDDYLRAQVEELAREVFGDEAAAGNVSSVTDGGVTTVTFAATVDGVVVNRSVEIYTVVVGSDASASTSFEDIATANNGINLHADNADQVVASLIDAVTSPYLIGLAGTASGEVLTGTIAGDRIVGMGGADTLIGSDGDDALLGGGGDDALQGDAGNDRLDGGLGNDTMAGGVGDDLYIVDSGADSVVEAASQGKDTVRSSVSFSLADHVEDLVLTGAALSGFGNALANHIVGNVNANELHGQGGGDVIEGEGGADLLTGGSGNDTLRGGADGDVVEGGEGDDSIDGGSEIDTASYAGAGSGVSVDLSIVIRQNTFGAGMDLLTGIENLLGSAWDDALYGNAGANRLDGGAGVDTMAGRGGADTYVVDDFLDSVAEKADEGSDTVLSSVSYALPENVEGLVLTGSSAIDGAGNGLANTLTGNGAANRLSGGGGNDNLDGGGGADTLIGGLGDDMFTIDQIGDVVRELPGGGTDSIVSSVSFTLPAEVENLALAGSAASAIGNALANRLDGNGAANLLDGGLGADRMAGGFGNDTYIVDNGGDLVSEAGGGGIDRVFSSVTFTLDAGLEYLFLTGSSGISGFGNGLDNWIVGNGAANRLEGNDGGDLLDGGAGADRMTGGAGDDSYLVDSTGDVVVESAGGGFDVVESSVSYVLSPEVEVLVLTGIGAVNGTGNALANVLIGNAAANRLDGGAGADELHGGLGNDIYFVDAGDTVLEKSGEGTDEVRTALSSYSLTANVETLRGTATTGQRLTGNGIANTIIGGVGNDTLDGGSGGADTLAGGLGNDLYIVGGGDIVSEAFNAGTDEVRTALSSYVLTANVDRLTGTSTSGQILTGNGIANVITGGSGNDRLDGGSGGADTLAGGLGNDVYVVGGSDVVSEAANAGTDEVRTALSSYLLTSNVEKLTGTSTSGQILTGNGIANTITGGVGNDTLDGGGGGADTLAGGLGNDIYVVGGGDGVSEAANAGTDEVRTALSSYTLTANVETLRGTATTGQRLTGNGIANTIIGGVGNDTLDGGSGGADTLAGGLGNDVYVVGGSDIVSEAANAGTDEVRTALSSYTLGTNVENLRGTAATGQLLTGNATANAITGGAGNDTLVGGGGADGLAGLGGADMFRYHSATDSAPGQADLIGDFQSGLDKIDLSRVDANTTAAGDQAFSWIGAAAFSGVAGELRTYDSGGYRWIAGDTDGDSDADILISFHPGAAPVGPADFVL